MCNCVVLLLFICLPILFFNEGAELSVPDNELETTLFTNLTTQFVISTQEVTRYSIHNPQLLIFSPQICHTFGFRVSAYSANSHFISP